MYRLSLVLVLATLTSACVTTRAQTPIERPTLDVPPAPPRVIEPAPMPEVAMPEPVPDLPPPPVVPTPPSRSPRSTAPRETQKPEVKPDPVAQTPPVEPPPAAAPPQAPSPPPLLRTPATANTGAAEKQIRETINRAQGILNGINYQGLSSERQKEYQNAKDFLQEAETALKNVNLELSKEYAEKAEKLARSLQGS